MKNLFRLIGREARPLALFVGVLATFSGLLSAALVALGNHVVNRTPTDQWNIALIVAFAALGLGKLISGYLSEVLLTRFCHESIAQIRQRLVTRILDVPLRRYESLDQGRVLACLTDDITAVNHALSVIPGILINAAIAVGGAAYLLWLSPPTFLLLGAGAAAGFFCHRFLSRRAERYWAEARATGDKLHEHYRTFTAGIKELKMHAPRRHRFLQQSLAGSATEFAEQSVTATRRHTLAHCLSHAIFFLLIGVILFVLPQLGLLTGAELSGYVITSLFLMGPVSGIIYSIPAVVRARIALEKIASLGVDLDVSQGESTANIATDLKGDWRTLRLQGAEFTYIGSGSREFTAGPIDLEIPRGELLFITGANGSGKTTLGKMLAGLYEPARGALKLDEVEVDTENRDRYRQHISAVFSEFHLFDTLMGGEDFHADLRTARRYVQELGLGDVLSIDDHGAFSSTSALSTGQRKRLALLCAYLEDRDIVIFDEWAADQDPEFRRIFYEELLPALHDGGKTVIVISHDDRYFHCGERLVELVDGKLVNVQPAAAAVATTSS